MTSPGHVVVVGAGLAGLRTIEDLRGRGYAGPVTLVGAEPRLPYDRPPLSKKLMTGALDDTTLRPDLDSLQVEVRLAERAVALADGVLATDGGEHAFDALVLATGATPVTLPGDGRQHVLRTIEDALELRGLLRSGAALAIVGAGWIGAELATAAAELGCQVTVLEAARTPLAAAVGAEVGGLTARWYTAAGVDLRLGQGVDSVQPGGLALAGGGWLPADVVVTAVGVRPAVSWLAGSAVALDNGVAVRLSAADLGGRGVRRGRLRGIRVGAVRPPAPVRALGRRAARPEVVAANVLAAARPTTGAVLLVGAVRPDGAVRRPPRGRPAAGVAGRPEGVRWAAAWLAAGGWSRC